MPEEFDAVEAPPFEERGKVTDEYIDIYKELWTNDEPQFHGNYRKFSNIYFSPKPIQTPHPPIWIGGESKPAMRRAAKRGDAWFPIGCNPKHPLDTMPRWRAAVATIRSICDLEARDPDTLELAYWSVWTAATGDSIKANDGERMMLTGSADAILDDIGKLKELGVSKLLFNFLAETENETLDRIQAFSEDILSKTS